MQLPMSCRGAWAVCVVLVLAPVGRADEETLPTLVAQVGHATWVNAVAFSPDGKLVLTGSRDRTARLWDVQTGRELRVFTGHAAAILSVAFSPDGKQVLTASGPIRAAAGVKYDSTARLWDAQTGKELRVFTGHSHAVHSVAMSPDGKHVLTGSADKTARLWDALTGKEIRVFTGHDNGIPSAAFSPDGKQFVSGSWDQTARLWDVQTGKEIRSFTGHAKAVTSVAFAPDGKQVLTAGDDRTARLWDVQTGKEVRMFAHPFEVYAVAFAPDGKQVLTSWNGTAQLWDAETGKEMRVFAEPAGYVGAVAFAPDGRRVLTSGGHKMMLLDYNENRTARLWDTQTGKQIRVFGGDADWISAVAISRDGKHLLTGGHDKTARLWDAQLGKEIRALRGHDFRVRAVTFSPDGKQVLTGCGLDLPIAASAKGNRTAQVWDVRTGIDILAIKDHPQAVYAVAFSPDGSQVLTGCNDNQVRLWDVQSGKVASHLLRSYRSDSCRRFLSGWQAGAVRQFGQQSAAVGLGIR